jgi:pimeloyl-ACP methyl ester carboxylesterase
MPETKINGVRLHYELFGKGGVPIVFISGTGAHSQIWKPYQVPFFEKKFTVLISDHRGVGESEKPDSFYSTEIFAEDIIGLMKYLKLKKAHLVGHSMGGRVAQWIALKRPDMVRSLVLADTGSGNFSKNPEFIRGVPLDTAMDIAEKGFPRYLRDHMESEFIFSSEFRNKEPERFKEMVDLKLSNAPPLKAYLRHVIARQMHETTDRLGEIKAPTLVLVGELDSIKMNTGSHFKGAEVLAKKIPGAKLVKIKGAAHGIFWEQPEKSNRAVLDFISAH